MIKNGVLPSSALLYCEYFYEPKWLFTSQMVKLFLHPDPEVFL